MKWAPWPLIAVAGLAALGCGKSVLPRPALPVHVATEQHWSVPGEPAPSVLHEPYAPLSLKGFEDSANHYIGRRRSSDYPRYDASEVAGIAENILLHQRSGGGWAENWDPQRILNPVEKRAVWDDKARQDASFDNRSTYTHIAYLARARALVGDTRYQEACVRGLEFVLEAQHDNGGFPHSYPGEEAYHRHTTFMDDVTSGVLLLLREVARGLPPYDFVVGELRVRVRQALARGEAGLLELQVEVLGEPAIWAGQYDRATNQPTKGRAYELPGLVSRESVGVVRYLMGIEPPSRAVVASIEGAVSWFERAKLHGIRLETIDAPPVQYAFHSSTTDKRVVADSSAPPLWARFYELDTNRPFMANPDGRKVYSLEEVTRERRTGYSWYGEYGKQLLIKDYPKWRARRAKSSARDGA